MHLWCYRRTFTGGCAEYAVAAAGMIARETEDVEFCRGSISSGGRGDVLAELFECALVTAGQTALAQEAAGNVAAYTFNGNASIVSNVSLPASMPKPQEAKWPNDVRMAFFIGEETTARLDRLTALFDGHALKAHVGSVLSLAGARMVHEMPAGTPHKRGKLVLDLDA